MDNIWATQFLKASDRSNEFEERQFLELLEQISGKLDIDSIRILMKSFSSKPDYGLQESVIRILSTAPHELVIQGILEELPRLIDECCEWAEVLIGTEVENRPKLLENIANNMPMKIRKKLFKMIVSEDFSSFYENALNIKIEI